MIRANSIHELVDAGIQRVALACGVFDGLHYGHQKIIAELKAAATRYNATPVLITFYPHPMSVLLPDKSPQLIYSREHKLTMLGQMDIAATVTIPFTKEFSAVPAEEFVHDLFRSGLDIRAICVGSHWRFGHKAQGDTTLLKRMLTARGIEVIAVPEIEDENGKVSSSHIRRHIAQGDLAVVNRLMGRNYSIYGKVKHGKGIATNELHYPTANIQADNGVYPPCGIYAANAVLFKNGVKNNSLPGVLYLGYAPTYFEDAPPTPFVEIHIFNFHDDIYGEFVEVEFLEFIRADKKYESSEALREQIAVDIEAAREIHNQKRTRNTNAI